MHMDIYIYIHTVYVHTYQYYTLLPNSAFTKVQSTSKKDWLVDIQWDYTTIYHQNITACSREPPYQIYPHTLLQLKWIWLTNALLRGTCPQNTNDICPLCKAIDQLCGTHIKLASARPFPWAKRCRKKRREIYESWFQTSWWETFLWNSWHWKKRSQDLRYGAQFNAPQKEKHAFFSMWIITWFQCGGLLVDFRFKTFTTRWKTSPVVGVFKNPRCIPKKTWIPSLEV